jgi:serine/threonine-protein kinase CLA4
LYNLVSEDPLLEKEIALIMHESLKGLEYMHTHNFIHRDIKGANILATASGGIKLGTCSFLLRIASSRSRLALLLDD